jgi:MFS family permease
MKSLRINFLVYCVTNFVWAAVFNLWYSFLPKFYQALGAPLFFVGFLTALERLCEGSSNILGGWLADRYGRKRVIICGSLIGNLSLLFFLRASGWIWLIPAIAFFWITVGIQAPTIASLISESVKKKERAKAFSILSVFSSIPAIFTISLGGLLIEGMGLVEGMRISLLLSFFVGMTATLLYAFLLRETLTRAKRMGMRWTFPKKVVYFILSYGLLMFGVSLVSPFVIFYSVDVVGISMLEWGFVRSFFTFFILLVTLAGGLFSDRYGRRSAILLSFASLLFPLTMLMSKNLLHIILAHIFASALFLGAPSVAPYILEKAKTAKSMGIANFCFTLAMFGGSSLGGWLYSISPSYPFLLSIGVRLVGFLLGIALI